MRALVEAGVPAVHFLDSLLVAHSLLLCIKQHWCLHPAFYVTSCNAPICCPVFSSHHITSELFDRPTNEVVGLLLISNIALHRDSLPAVAGYPLNELVETLLSASPGHHRGAFDRQRPHRSFSDAARGPSHNRDLAVQSVRHVRHLSVGQGTTTRFILPMSDCECWVPCLSEIYQGLRVVHISNSTSLLPLAARRGTSSRSYPRYGITRCFHTLRPGCLVQSSLIGQRFDSREIGSWCFGRRRTI